jgi:UDP-2,3-diacylglucosamine pyrophosphatase LpxH
VNEKTHYRTIWISDVHLGTRHSQVGALLQFLRDTECNHLYIVGDFIDGWQLRRKWYWTEEYNLLVQKLLRKNRKQTQVTFISGNHDEFLEKFFGIAFGNVRLMERAVHTAADGKEYLVIHGHQFDGLAQFNRLLDQVGSALYDKILDLNAWINRAGRFLGFGYWSFASFIKLKAKAAMKYVKDYEEAMIQYGRRIGVAGVICGHIHRPEIRDLGDMLYVNCGDWVENCTALAEDFQGKLKLIRFHESNALYSGRGTGTHDAGDGSEGDRGTRRAHGIERGGGGRTQPPDPGVLCASDANAGREDSHPRFHVQK